jgi:ATP-dependent helicase YprA (DUF1998 family)
MNHDSVKRLASIATESSPEGQSRVDGLPRLRSVTHCGNANDPLDKGLSAMLLDRLLDSV